MAKRKSKRPKRIIYRIWNSAQRVWQFPSIIATNEENADGFEIVATHHKEKVFKLMQTLVRKDAEWERRQEMKQEEN